MLLLFLISLSGCGDGGVTIHTYGSEDTAVSAMEEASVQSAADQRPDVGGAPDTESARTDGSELLAVHVCGAVRTEGVYRLPKGSRVTDAVDMAGGFTDEAATDAVNLARLLTDGEKITIPTVREVEEGRFTEGRSSGAESDESGDGKVDINHADAEGLTSLPGIGPSRAADIVAYRDKNGTFHKPEDLMNVPGIKEGTYQKLKDRVIVR